MKAVSNDTFQEIKQQASNQRGQLSGGRPETYPWDEFFQVDQPVQLEAGVDFPSGRAATFASNARNAAKKRDLKLHIVRVDENGAYDKYGQHLIIKARNMTPEDVEREQRARERRAKTEANGQDPNSRPAKPSQETQEKRHANAAQVVEQE